jgi:Flp pilus assembly protein TadG
VQRLKRRSERGSALMLMPAGVLILVVLAAMTVDSARAFQAQRELADVASSVANDVATEALVLDGEDFSATGRIRVDEHRAEAAARSILAARAQDDLGRIELVSVGVSDPPPGEAPVVTVVLRASVDTIFARAVPGGPDRTDLRATGRAAPQVVV